MKTDHSPPTILVLAGKRDGALDPLAERAGVTHKAVVPIAGKPLIGHVLATLEKAWDDAQILVSIHDESVLEDVEEYQRLKAAGRLKACEAQAGIVESVEAAAEEAEWPILITTGDNALTTAEALHAIHGHGLEAGADVAIGLAKREDIQAAHPDGQYGFYQFKDIAISNCNLFWLGNPRAFSAVESFRTGGQFFKNRSRIIKAFGLGNMIRFLLKTETVDSAMERLSKRFGVKVIAHKFTDGRLAIDVDNERTYRVTEELMRETA